MRGTSGRAPFGAARGRIGAVGLVTVLLATVVAGSGATAVLAAGGATVSASPDTAGETATHVVTKEVRNDAAGSSLDHVDVDYTAGSNPADVSDVGAVDVVRFGVDRDGDGRIEDSAMGGSLGVSASNNGHTLTIQNTSGPSNLKEGDVVIAEFTDVRNPDSAGVYDVQVELNGAESATTSYRITSDPTPTATATATAQDTATATATATTTDTGTTTPTSTETGGDGGVETATATPTATPNGTPTASDTEPATATPTATETATEHDAATLSSAGTTPAAAQRMTEEGLDASLLGAAKATFVLTAVVVAGAIWLKKVQF